MTTAHTVADNFNDNSIHTTRWNAFGNPAQVAERERAHEIWPAGGVAGYTGPNGQLLYDLTGSYIQVQVVRALTFPVGKVETFFGSAPTTQPAAHQHKFDGTTIRIQDGAITTV